MYTIVFKIFNYIYASVECKFFLKTYNINYVNCNIDKFILVYIVGIIVTHAYWHTHWKSGAACHSTYISSSQSDIKVSKNVTSRALNMPSLITRTDSIVSCYISQQRMIIGFPEMLYK